MPSPALCACAPAAPHSAAPGHAAKQIHMRLPPVEEIQQQLPGPFIEKKNLKYQNHHVPKLQ